MKETLIAIVVFIGLVIAAKIGSHYEASEEHPISSKTPIEPELHIIVKDGELDTTFVYKQPVR